MMYSVDSRGRRPAACWLLLAGLATSVGCVDEPTDGEVDHDLDLEIAVGWDTTRAAREAAIEDYLAANDEDFQWFKDTALGSSGIPMIMFRLFPELFPEIWGAPAEHFAKLGLGVDPFDPGKVLPLGLGYTSIKPPVDTPLGPVDLQVVNLTCIGCHGGRVTDAAGATRIQVGAPNAQFSGFRNAVIKTVNSPGYTALRFRLALLTKPPGWLYGDPAMLPQETLERALFLAPDGAEKMLATLKAKVQASVLRFSSTIGTYSYAAVPNPPDLAGPTPGYLDALGSGVALIVDPSRFTPAQLDAILPPAPGPVDIMSVWRQVDRPAAQWDGSITSPLHRNLGAEFGVVGNPTLVSLENAVRTTRFVARLPAPPYPFDIDPVKATRGKSLYDAYCAGCHHAGADERFDPRAVGTDPNRAVLLTDVTAGLLVEALRTACSDPAACNGPDGAPLPDDQIVAASGGYMALPLDGIWARAPYLHNGSVPTLAALLTGERPAQFYRGNTTFDQARVGFTWDRPGPGTALYDTTRAGLSNRGHDTPRFNGPVDWKRSPAKLADLLEYLKTL